MDVWADEAPLYIWAGGGTADLTQIKVAKKRLEYERDHLDGTKDIPVKVVPIVVSATVAPPSDARILAIDSRPPWIMDYRLIASNAQRDEWVHALCWCFGIQRDNYGVTRVVDIVQSIFPNATEISPEDLEAERRMREYVQGLV